MGFPRWAPLTWYIFHKISIDYDDTYKEHYKIFFQTMKTIIPCKTCRNHFIENTKLEENQVEPNITADKIFPWTVRIHNMVNRTSKKREYTTDDAKALYDKPIDHNKLFAFMNDYMMYNLNKGADKDRELLAMFKAICYIFPNKVKRERLIKYVEKAQPKKDKLWMWIRGFQMIAR